MAALHLAGAQQAPRPCLQRQAGLAPCLRAPPARSSVARSVFGRNNNSNNSGSGIGSSNGTSSGAGAPAPGSTSQPMPPSSRPQPPPGAPPSSRPATSAGAAPAPGSAASAGARTAAGAAPSAAASPRPASPATAPSRPGSPPLAPGGGGNGQQQQRAPVDAFRQQQISELLIRTQKNMLELNNCRVRAQEELAVAHRRIHSLEVELEALRAENELKEQLLAEAQLPPPFSDDRGVAVAAPVAPDSDLVAAAVVGDQQQQPPQQQQAYQQQQRPQSPQSQAQQQQQQQLQQVPQQQQQQQVQQQQQPPQPPPPPQEQQAPPDTITLSFTSGWNRAFLHYSADGGPWTDVPGVRMTDTKEHHTKVATVRGSRLEFVMTNGDNEWDSPGRHGHGLPENYVIGGPGTYRLKSGRLERVQ